MPHEVTMPQLGMNQDSAVIVAWLKAEGDRVTAGDPLLEVETDKATVEVEATADGWLAGIRSGDGADVPVGEVIALIVDSEAEVAGHAGAAPATLPDEDPAPEPEAAAEPAPAPPPTADPVAPARTPPITTPPTTAKVLASPKAKRVASERGIDLAQLRAQGVPEPIHVGDLSQATGGGQSWLGARVDGTALDALLSRSEDADRAMLLAAFAAGAWRTLFNTADVAVALRDLDGSLALVPNPDRGGEGEAGAAALTLVDLCDTRIGSYAPAGGGVTLCAARAGDAFQLTLSFGEGALPMPHAVALLDDIAARVENPIRQLL